MRIADPEKDFLVASKHLTKMILWGIGWGCISIGILLGVSECASDKVSYGIGALVGVNIMFILPRLAKYTYERLFNFKEEYLEFLRERYPCLLRGEVR